MVRIVTNILLALQGKFLSFAKWDPYMNPDRQVRLDVSHLTDKTAAQS
jgi:hypothetical protein